MLTYNDFLLIPDRAEAIRSAIQQYQQTEEYRIALDADEYDRQKNTTIYNYVRNIYSMSGVPMIDFTAANNKIASNYFHRLNTQRCTYSLGNGVSFASAKQVQQGDKTVTIDETKLRLGPKFDTDLYKCAYKALIHGMCFGFWNYDRLIVFPMTEFVPLWDEDDGSLRAGIRYWQLNSKKPMTAVLYEEDGYTKYRSNIGNSGANLVEVEPKHAYKTNYKATEETGAEIVGYENYGSLPIVPFYGSRLHQSTLVGMKWHIDSFDLIQSGFANDLSDCAQIYWLIGNAMGMTKDDLREMMNRLKLWHVGVIDKDQSSITPYTQEIPFQARVEYLKHIRNSIYEAFGGLDVHTIAAGDTNDHVDAAYQPMDEEADDFEYQAIEFIQQILALQGIEDMPVFKRNRVSNVKEQIEAVMLEAQYLDEETVLRKLPNITVDEIPDIMARKDAQSYSRFDMEEGEPEEEGQE